MKKKQLIEVDVTLTWEILEEFLDDCEIYDVNNSGDWSVLCEIAEDEGISESELIPFKDQIAQYMIKREEDSKFDELEDELYEPLENLSAYYSEEEIHDYITYWFEKNKTY